MLLLSLLSSSSLLLLLAVAFNMISTNEATNTNDNTNTIVSSTHCLIDSLSNSFLRSSIGRWLE